MSQFSSLFVRTVLAAQSSATATSLFCSVIGKSSLPDSTDAIKSPVMSSSLPWIDDLHNTISNIYIDRGSGCSGLKSNAVQIHPDATIENPIICYYGIGEIERIFRARTALSRDDNTALLEFVYVQASDDSIAAGECKQNRLESYNPPTIQVVYRLQKTYGSFFSLNTMLKVTVQVQNTDHCRKIILQLPERTKSGILGTSGLTKNVVGGFNVMNLGVKYAFARDLWRSWLNNKMVSQSDSSSPNGIRSHSYVAEVIKIEECWNEVELVKPLPFHCSRRINGLLLGGLTYMLSFVV